MSEYYAVQRSSDYLQHYGVRGMKWGIRRARKQMAKGQQDRANRTLSNTYKKASVKLGVLAANANLGAQQKRYKMAKARMAQGAAMSGAMSAGLTAGVNHGLSFKDRLGISTIAGLGGTVAGALANSRGISARRHISARGHKRAQEKMKSWNREMNAAFKGTRYGGKPQRDFQRQIMGLSQARDPKQYAHSQRVRAEKELARARKRRR